MAAQSPDAAGWRGSPGGAPGGSAAGSQHWRKSSPLAGAQRGFFASKWLQVMLLLAGVVACGIGIYVIFKWSPSTGLRILVATAPEYQFETVPLNPHSASDFETVSRLSALKHRLQPVSITTLESLTEPPVDSGSVKEVMVIVVSLLAGRDGQGNYFLLQNSDPDIKDKLLREDVLWTWLEKLNPKQPKLLVLDLARVTSDWRTGQFHPDIWNGLTQKAEKISGLVVLTSCASGEQSWASRLLGESGTSAFLHNVVKGLCGEADANGDKAIHVSELHSYVLANTAHWVVNNRDEQGQHPQLIPATENLQGRDFEICKILNGKTNPFSGSGQAAESNAELEKRLVGLWQRRDQLATHSGSSPPWKDFSVGWGILNDELLAAEQALDTGHADRAQGMILRASQLADAIQKGASPAGQSFIDFPYLRSNVTSRWDSATSSGSASASGQPFFRAEEVLKRHLEDDGPWPMKRGLSTPLIGQAEALRDVAEQAGSPDPVATRWIQKSLEETEPVLRRFEDDLFSGTPPTSSDPRFTEFTSTFKGLQSLAATVTDAEQALLEARSKLPGLMRWAAERNGDREIRERLLQVCITTPQAFSVDRPVTVMEAWELAARGAKDVDSVECLVAALVGWTGRLQYLTSETGRQKLLENGTKPSAGEQLQQATVKSREILTTIDARLRVEAEQLVQLNPESPQPLHRRRVVDLLRFPGLPAETRQKLRQKLHRYEEQMHAGTESVAKGSTIELTSAEDRQRADLFDSRWETFWILQIPGGLEEFQLTELVNTWNRIGTIEAPADALNVVNELGVKIAERWRSRLLRVGEQLKANVKFDDKRSRLQEAERSAVWLDFRDAHPFINAQGEPARFLRAYDRIELALLHARRLLDGYWVDEGDAPGTTPWYLEGANQCLAYVDQAGRSYGLNVADLTAELRARGRERQESSLKLTLEQKEQLRFGVSGNRLPVLARIAPSGGLPEGLPTIWMNLNDGNRVRVLGNGNATASQAPAEVTFQLERAATTSTEPDCAGLQGETLAFFRGHIWRANDLLEVKPCREAGRITKYTPAPAVSSVLIDGTDRRPVVIVLDCSFSMNDRIAGTQDQKFSIALRNLRSLLDSLVFKSEDQVGLILFGHRVAYGSRGRNQRWIEKVGQFPEDLTYLNDFEIRVPVGPFTQKKKEQILAELDTLAETGCHGNTPLVGAILEAMSEKMLPSSGGLVIAITDGEADEQDQFDREGILKNLLETSQSRVELVGFGFSPGNKDAEEQLANLKSMVARLKNVNFTNAPGDGELKEALKGTLNPRPYTLARLDSSAPAISEALGKSIDGLTPGNYEVRFPGFLPTRFSVSGGERFQFSLTFENNPSRRLLLSDVNYRLSVDVTQPELAEADDPVLIDYKSYTIDENGNPNLLVFLDRKLPFAGNTPVQLVQRPEQVDFEVTPLGAEWHGDLEWGLMPDCPVPTWKLVLHNFPIEKPVQVKGWWRRTRVAPGALVAWSKLAPSTSERPVEIPLPDPDGLFHCYAVRPRPTLVQFVLTFPVNEPVTAQMITALEKLDVQLGQVDGDGSFTAYDTAIRRDFGGADGSLIVEFDLSGIDLERSTLGVTSVRAIREGALTAPIFKITQQDRTGNVP